MDKEFCLLDEPWIKVLDEQNVTREVSLIDIFTNAHRYKRLAGETVTQDAAILRLLLAVAITVFYRYRADGCEDCVLEYDDPEEEILNRWSEYWDSGAFNANVFQEYLETYRERFYLFHPETPFWQVADLEDGTNYSVINLFGNIKESNNAASRHHFHTIDGSYIDNISYAEAARWIVYNNAYSVNVKTKVDGENKPTGVGRLGQLGLIIVEENTLYKIMMMNLCALNINGEVWSNPKPIWEKEPRTRPGVEIVAPDNLPQLYTIQSRRLLLYRDNEKILGYRSIGGDYYSTVDDLTEPMTLLRRDGKKKISFKPKKHAKEIVAWREFPSLLVENELKPGIICWLENLMHNSVIDNKQIVTFRMIGLEYGDGMSYTNGELIDESLSMSNEFLNQVGRVWITYITDQVNKCEDVVQKALYKFAKNLSLYLYKGDTSGTKRIKELLAVEYYFKIDKAFREWLISIEPSSSKRDIKEREWQLTSSQTAEAIVRNYIANLSPQLTMAGAKAFGGFKKELYKIYPKNSEEGGE